MNGREAYMATKKKTAGKNSKTHGKPAERMMQRQSRYVKPPLPRQHQDRRDS
jgi:hypothetical protein